MIRAAVLFLGLFALASCAPALTTHTVTLDGLRFQPESLTVKVGDSVVWVNRDPFPHTATSKLGGFDSGEIAVEKSWTYKAGKAGEFPYLCTYHPTMKGMLRVQ